MVCRREPIRTATSPTCTQRENSEVLPEESVAVAVIELPPEVSGKLTLKAALQLLSVMTVVDPMKLLP